MKPRNDWFVLLLGVVGAVYLSASGGCIDGGRVYGLPAPGDLLGPPPDIPGEDGDVGDVEGDAPDVGDVPADGDAGPGDVVEDLLPDVGVCTSDDDCAPLDDGDKCNGTWRCEAGECVEDPTPVSCAAAGVDVPVCFELRCVPSTGACAPAPAPAGGSCTDGDACTIGDHCEQGRCVAQGHLHCDDHNPCTEDRCEGGQCAYDRGALAGAACDDGNPCTLDDACAVGTCQGVGDSACACESDEDCAAFDDGRVCNGTLRCFNGSCVVNIASLPSCDAELGIAPLGCKVGRCDEAAGGCVEDDLPDGTACDDGDPCTVGDVCGGGVCLGSPMVCDDEPCTTSACVDGLCAPREADEATCGCAADADCAALDDGDPCNGTLACVRGVCRLDPATVAADCLAKAQGPCQVCAPDGDGVCTVQDAPVGTACDDGDACTSGDACQAGVCVGDAVSCAAAGDCERASCHPFAGCRVDPVGHACDDGDPCTLEDVCVAGACAPGHAKECPAPNACTVGACDPGTGVCVTEPVTGACDDGDACTTGDACVQGTCGGKAILCDDGNPCTVDSCDPELGCVFTPDNGILCDDGTACTRGDHCADGVCVGQAAGCVCLTPSDCAQYEDGDPCNGTLFCLSGHCALDPATVVTCDGGANTTCRANVCNPATGACEMTPRADGAACDDGDPCTAGDACSGGVCDGLALACDDGNPCTADTCAPDTGCAHAPAPGGTCDDGNACTADTTCQDDGTCGGGTNTCPACTSDDDCAAYEDGDRCNGLVRCVDGSCQVDPGTVVVCPDGGDACRVKACDPLSGTCAYMPQREGLACQDGDACTQGDTCSGGACVGGAPSACDDNPCADGSCAPQSGLCVYTAKAGLCEDGDPCTVGDTCFSGACAPGGNVCVCEEDQDCAVFNEDRCAGTMACVGGTCVLEPGTEVQCGGPSDSPCAYAVCDPATGSCVDLVLGPGVECDDGDVCTVHGRCDADQQCASAARDCDDGDPCTVDSCDPTQGCVHVQADAGTACDDGDPCTADTSCLGGACAGGAKVCECSSKADCPQGGDACTGEYQCVAGKCVKDSPIVCVQGANPCRPAACDPAAGQCVLSTAANGTACDDGNLCTANDFCFNGVCTGNKVSCDDDNPCTADTCQAGVCSNEPLDGVACDDGDQCTKLEQCHQGVCGGGTNVCTCATDAQCEVFDDHDKCNGVWRCVGGFCEAVTDSEVICLDDDPNDCLDPSCDPESGECVFAKRPNHEACDDGDACTTGDQCNAVGGCVGVVTVTCEDSDPDDCMTSVCDPQLGACVPRPEADGTACDDGDDCTQSDACAVGTCTGAPVDCDDGNPCTANGCRADGGCYADVLFGACDDGDPCTDTGVCVSGQCQGGASLCDCTTDADCDYLEADRCAGTWSCVSNQCKHSALSVVTCQPDPDQPCKEATCQPETGLCKLVNAPNGRGCDDGNPCTVDDRCLQGVCGGQPTSACDDSNPCTDDLCDPADGSCSHAPLPNHTPCDDGLACDTPSVCADAVCVPGLSGQCPCMSNADCADFEDGDVCNGTLICGPGGQCVTDEATVVVCPPDPTGCAVPTCEPSTGQCVPLPRPDGIGCDDGDVCTYGDRCQGGVCEGLARGCDDGDPCTADQCDPVAGCVHLAFSGPCDDGDPCTVDDVCVGGVCDGAPNPCGDDNECTVDVCQSNSGCVHVPKPGTLPCDDGLACTEARCIQGTCVSQPDPSCVADCAGQDNGTACDDGDPCTRSEQCVNGVCTGLAVDCSALDGPCAQGQCNALSGLCEASPVADGQDCDDGDPCTQGDRCGAGVCTGDAVSCTTDAPCKEAACVSGVGCVENEAAGACDDGVPCTFEDRCVGGGCAGVVREGVYESFDSGAADGWTFTSTGVKAGWQVAGFESLSAPFALYAGNPHTRTSEDPIGAWNATATRVALPIPEDAVAAELRLAVRVDVQDAGCDADVFTVLVNGASVFSRCDGTGGHFVPVVVNLTAYGTQPVEVALVFDTVTAAKNGGAGVFVDDFEVSWACPVAPAGTGL